MAGLGVPAHVEPEQSAANCAGRRARARIWPVGTTTASPPPRRSAIRPPCASLAPVAAGECDPSSPSHQDSFPHQLAPLAQIGSPSPGTPWAGSALPRQGGSGDGCSLVPDTQTHSSRAQGASAAKSLGRRKEGCVLREPGTPQNTSRLQGPFSYQPPLLKERTRAFFGGRGVIPLFFSPPVCKLETTTSAKALPRTVASLHPGAEAGPPGGRSAAGRAGSATPRLRPPPAVTATVCADRAGGEGASPGAARRWAAVLPLPAPSRSGGGTWLGRCLRPGEEVRCSAKG